MPRVKEELWMRGWLQVGKGVQHLGEGKGAPVMNQDTDSVSSSITIAWELCGMFLE